MAEGNGFVERPALNVPAGHAVLRPTAAGTCVLCLKGQRRAKGHLQDYTVALCPVAEGGHRLDFIDPEDPLTDCGAKLFFVADPKQAGPHPRPGDLAECADGLWLAVSETSGLYRFVSFIHVETGEVRRLREATLLALHRRWQIEAPAEIATLFPDLAFGH